MLLAGSRGSAYAAGLIMAGIWRGVTLLLAGTDTLGCVGTLSPPTSAGALLLHRVPLILFHGTRDEVNPISALVAQAVGAAPWVRLRRAVSDGHDLASLNHSAEVLAALVGEGSTWAEQLAVASETPVCLQHDTALVSGGAGVTVEEAQEAMRRSMANKCALREAAGRMIARTQQPQQEDEQMGGVGDSEWDE